MEINEILANEYFDKVLLSLIPIVLKGLLSKDLTSNIKRFLSYFICYIFPLGTIIWINLDENILINKLTVTLIILNFAFILYNYFQQKLNEHYLLITQFTNAETDKVKQINDINRVQVEKVNAINENQKYILQELSKINDRIIQYFGRN